MYPRISHKLVNEPWSITESMHDTMMTIFIAHLEGKTAMTDSFLEAKMRPSQIARNPEAVKADEMRGPYGSIRVPGTTLSKRGPLGIIPVEGVLGIKMSMLEEICGGCSYERLQDSIETAYNDPSISRVMFDVSSPGGMSCGMFETMDMVADLSKKKDTYSVSVDLQASAAQGLASQVRTCYGTQFGTYGSIGCFIAKLDLSKQREMEGENLQIIRAGKFKAMGADAPLTPEERQIYQTIVDSNMAQFRESITSGRAQYAKKKIADDTMEGQIFSGEQALENGLLDALVPSVLSIVRRLS